MVLKVEMIQAEICNAIYADTRSVNRHTLNKQILNKQISVLTHLELKSRSCNREPNALGITAPHRA